MPAVVLQSTLNKQDEYINRKQKTCTIKLTENIKLHLLKLIKAFKFKHGCCWL